MTATLLEPLIAEVPDLAWILDATDAEIEFIWEELTTDERNVLGGYLLGRTDKSNWVPLPHQIPPPPGWYLWLLLAGRGTGKTDACAHYMDEHAMGPPCLPGDVPHRMLIVAPTLGDASEACVNGPSGLRAHNPAIRELTRKGGTFALWPNGSEAKELGAYTKADVERFRAGGNRCMVWCEEFAAWRYLRDAWDQIRLGLREGPHPHVIASTTPRNRPTLKRLAKAHTTAVTHATTADNPHLPAIVREALYETYGGTRLGMQELEGMILEDVEGALWTPELVEAMRIPKEDAANSYERIVVGVDPSWGTKNDECGIIAAGRLGKHGYALRDESGRMKPAAWGLKAIELYHELGADRLLAEANFQGEQVELVAKSVRQDTGLTAMFKMIHVSRGKRLRAEPVHALCEQGRGHIVGRLPLLEHQLTHWVPPEVSDLGDKGDPEEAEPAASDVTTLDKAPPSDFSPDRLDAFVFDMTELLLGSGGPARTSSPQGRLPDRRAGSMALARRG